MTNPLNPLYEAVAWVMEQIHTGLSTFLSPTSGLVWVLTIVILVVLMRLLLVPLFIKQMHATRKMSALAPQIQELRKKYKNDKQTLNQETMKLYKENGANPLAGCLPLLGQLPLFFALFSVLRAISVWKPGETPPYGLSHTFVVSAQQADIFGAHLPDKFLFPLAEPCPLPASAAGFPPPRGGLRAGADLPSAGARSAGVALPGGGLPEPDDLTGGTTLPCTTAGAPATAGIG